MTLTKCNHCSKISRKVFNGASIIKSKINCADYKPSDGFDEFCKQNIDLLKEEVYNLCKNGFTNSNEIKQKIKKTYKNRYFLIISK